MERRVKTYGSEDRTLSTPSVDTLPQLSLPRSPRHPVPHHAPQHHPQSTPRSRSYRSRDRSPSHTCLGRGIERDRSPSPVDHQRGHTWRVPCGMRTGAHACVHTTSDCGPTYRCTGAAAGGSLSRRGMLRISSQVAAPSPQQRQHCVRRQRIARRTRRWPARKPIFILIRTGPLARTQR